MDGMLGALIVRPPGSKILQRNESEHIMLLQDCERAPRARAARTRAAVASGRQCGHARQVTPAHSPLG